MFKKEIKVLRFVNLKSNLLVVYVHEVLVFDGYK